MAPNHQARQHQTGSDLSSDADDADDLYDRWHRRSLVPMTHFLLLDSVFAFALSIWRIVMLLLFTAEG